MSQYRSNQKQRSQLSQKSSLNQSFNKPKHPKFRFSQARLLVLATRQIFNARISSVLDQLRIAPKRRYNVLEIFNTMLQYKMRQSFMDIISYGQHRALGEIQTVTKRVNIKIFLCRCLDKLYGKTMRKAFYMISIRQEMDQLSLNRLDYYFTNIISAIQKFNSRAALRKIKSMSQKRKLAKNTIVPVVNTINRISIKNLKLSFQKIVLISSTQMYEDKYNLSQTQRKQFYDSQTKKSQFIANQRQSLHQLKVTIDNLTYQRNTMLGEMKRQKSIKINQVQQKIRALQRQYQQSQLQLRRFERCIDKYGLVIEKRNKLSLSSKGAPIRVHNLYNQLKYQENQKNELRSSSYISKILLNKQKFKQILLINFQPLRADNQDYQVYINLIQRNLICMYQNVPLNSIKLSQQYSLALQQNTGLKQFLSSLIFYDLLKEKGDPLLKINSQQLEGLFQNIFRFIQQQQSGQRDSELQDSFISYKSSKSLRKKSSIRTSVISNKSLK